MARQVGHCKCIVTNHSISFVAMASEEKAEPRELDLTKWLTAWVALATAISGILQFYYKEIFTPAKVPVNIALSLKISPLKPEVKPDDESTGHLILAMMNVTISNKGNKSVYLKNPTWMAFGMRRYGKLITSASFSLPNLPGRGASHALCSNKYSATDTITESMFVSCWNERLSPVINGQNGLVATQGFTDRFDLLPGEDTETQPANSIEQVPARELIGTGPITTVPDLKTGSEIQTQVLIPVSTRLKYDYLEVQVSVPTVSGIPSEKANKIMLATFINPQDFSPEHNTHPKVYQRLRGFCLTTARPASLVNILNAFKLPRRGMEDQGSTSTSATGTCYTSVPHGLYGPRLLQWADHTLGAEGDRFGAQFYDTTYEVPLLAQEEPAPSSNQTQKP